jgi:hypothetical protein
MARVGLQIGSGTSIFQNIIGGNGNGQGNGEPNANIWPRKPNTTPAESPDNWISIQKPDAGNALTYYKYFNEHLGTVFPNSGDYSIEPLQFKTAKSPKAVREFCLGLYTSPSPGYSGCLLHPELETGWQTTWVLVCNNLDDQTEYFPLRQAVSNSATTSAHPTKLDLIFLGDPIPNPSKEATSIDLNWPKEKGTLVVFEIGSGKKVWQTEVSNGRQQVSVPVKQLGAGVYGYRLEGDCPCPEPKRLIVIH